MKKFLSQYKHFFPHWICLFAFAFALLLILFCTSLAFVFTGSNKESRTVHIENGWGTKNIAEALLKEKVINNALVFELAAKWSSLDGQLKAGYYLFPPRLTVYQVLDKLAKGKTMTVAVTVPEGYTLEQITDLLVQKHLVDRDKFLAAINRTDYPFAFLEDKNVTSLEGYLFPTTYHFELEMDERQIITKMLKTFVSNLPENWESVLQKKRMSLHEMVTMASLVEKEAMVDKERPLIAGVFYNRLAENMRLESCVTVQYALGKHKTKLSYDDVKIKSPYNTYLHAGLPPGPIASPGRLSLKAAFYPAPTKDLFFVAKGDGTHFFSRSYNQHLANSRKGS